MSERVKRILEMATKEDQHSLNRLNQPKWETTKGSSYNDFNLTSLREQFVEKDCVNEASMKENINPEHVEKFSFVKNSTSMTEMAYVSSIIDFRNTFNENSDCPEKNTKFGENGRNENQAPKVKVNILSNAIIRQAALPVQPSEPHIGMTNNVEINNIAPTVNDNDERSEETMCFTQLKNVYTFDEENSRSPDPDPFEDSGSEYIPSPVSSTNSIAELNSSNDEEIIIEGENITQKQEYNNIRARFNKNGIVKTAATNSRGRLKRDKREHCMFCEQNITNFARHLFRRHKNETDVVRVMSLEKKSVERKYLLEKIRKGGNFVNSYGNEGFINPVRRPKSEYQRGCNDYLPCIRCKGFFLRTYLHRHLKVCHEKISNKDSKHAQADGLLLLHMSGSDENLFEDLKRNVFPYMVSDKITRTVMNDFLIKYYGQRYYGCHKEKHLTNTVSQRMRELARFLIILQDKPPKQSQLADYLRPIYFDDLVNATNEMCGYDPDLDTFRSPSLALRWATVLKQVCDIAMFLASKKNETPLNKEIGTLKQMIETQFRFYISTNANKDLSKKKWKKGSMLPLTEDVIKISAFIAKEEQKCAEELKRDPKNISKLRYLTELLLAHVIILNRKRSGEAQRITMDDYMRKEEDMAVQDIYQSLTVTEKVLVKSIKRFTIRGKKGRAVPVIFSKDMQKHTEVLLESRKFIAASNPYLFANPMTENSFLWSNRVLKKIATICNIKNIEAITATCLRKHIATIAQLISMGDSDLEQLSNHLGHEKATHLNFYRKTDDKLQIAKISKLLLLMENKSVGEYRGKSLEDIDLEIPDLNDTEPQVCSEDTVPNISKSQEVKHGKMEQKEIYGEIKKSRQLVPWTSVQKTLVEKFFKEHLTRRKPPRKNECQKLKDEHPEVFNNKTWAQIKIFIVNKYNKR